MKNLIILLSLATMLVLPNAAIAKKSKSATVKIDYIFKNVESGYDHRNKMVVYVDGDKIGESSAKNETEKNTYSFNIPTGKHDIKIVNYAYYDEKWEEHTEDNGYTYDCIVELDNQQISKSISISIVFDLDATGPTYKIK